MSLEREWNKIKKRQSLSPIWCGNGHSSTQRQRDCGQA